MQKKLINIGACRNRKDRSKIGGVVVLFEAWVQYCKEQKVDVVTIDSNKANYANVFVAYFSILWQFMKHVGKCDVVMLHGTAKDYLYIAPIVIFISKLCRKKVALRKFAGNFAEIYNAGNGMKKCMYDYVLKNSSVQFWETKSLVAFGKERGSNSLWFPNVRDRQETKRPIDRPYSCRFVFLSRIERQKGIDVLRECFSSLPEEYHVDIYGPVKDYEFSDLNGKNYSYKCSVEPSKIPEILSKYDVLVLPTLWRAEGYPGVIIEGYGVGIPSIASKIGAIPEIVDDGKTGLLIAPGNEEELKRAILSINEKNYKEMVNNALMAFGEFDAQIVNNRILKTVMS